LAATTAWTQSEVVWLFVLGGVISMLLKVPSAKLSKSTRAFSVMPFVGTGVSQSAGGAASATTLKLLGFFGKAGVMVFGSGLAIVPFLYGGVVKEYHWLNERQFMDAVAVAMITPGPVVITVGFIGFLVAGFTGASLAALATFLPCYLLTIIPAPYFKKYGKRPDIAAFVAGVTAAATGAISGAVIILGRKSISDLPTALLALVTAVLLFKSRKINSPAAIKIRFRTRGE